MKKRLLANLSSFISGYKRDVDEGIFVGNFTFDTDSKEFVLSWSNDRANNRIIEADTVISDIPNLNGSGVANITLSADVTARARTKEGRRLYRVRFTEGSESYDMIVDSSNTIIDRRG